MIAFLFVVQCALVSSFLAIPTGLIVAGRLFGDSHVNASVDATTWLVRDHKGRHRGLVYGYQGGEQR